MALGSLLAGLLAGCGPALRPRDFLPPATPEEPLRLPSAGPSVEVRVQGSVTPMAGRWVAAGEGRRFEPRFPWLEGVTYELWNADEPERPLWEFTLAAPDRPAPRCLGRDPAARILPENLLRLYLTFSTPMARGHVAGRVRLHDGDGQALSGVFLDLPQELWNPEGTRLTLLFDPGRVKRGLRTHRELGRALEAGRRYELRLDAGWPDVHGQPLGEEVRLGFEVGPADVEPPDPLRWQLEAGSVGTRDPLRLRFEAPVDRALGLRLLRIELEGRTLAGRASLDAAGLEYTFVPDRPWPAGRRLLIVPRTLEDWAGNRPGRPFELRRGPGDPPQEGADLRFEWPL